MTLRHPLDGNAIAADAHYERAAPGDHDFCDRCGLVFGEPDEDGETVVQHRTMFMFCEDCGDDAGDDE